VAVALPPLREHKEDIPALAERFLVRFSREMNRSPHRLTDDALRVLMAHEWPGNVRELQNAIERAVVLASDRVLSPRDFPVEIRGADRPAPLARESPSRPERWEGAGDAAPAPDGTWTDRPLHEAVDELKRARIRDALAQSAGNQTRAAALLGMRQSNLSRLMKSLGLG
jgi:DNA-binding NtrC family response regulator